ncbi:MAG TPA: FAD-dependent oxidoreductase [Actinophytocola sp.]|uniref:FAD-binding oxidoreductase n=1 Tax=Actinophytocola sp. TaxID=1872138 RepID=UPI002DDD96A3|nr:FAD-dependent oxidoreductase [Actinophytocola sp.]HEV2780615.1 FAD-dependent oxidoreductase [Actinophytocola sp.]
MTTLDERNSGIAEQGDDAYAEATQVFNLAAPVEPAAAVTVESVAAIRAALSHAVSNGLSVRVHTTGHASATFGPMPDSLLIRTRLAGPVVVDSARRVARIPAGTRWGAVVDALAPHGLAAPHGSAATVGVVGYLLRGGISFYGRSRGLAVNSVRAIELVTADGELRRATALQDPELFWALRGGGGGFGIVTALEVDLFPATKVITGAAFWPATHAPELLNAWRHWTMSASPEVSTSLRLLNLPPLPDVPPVLAGRTMLCIDGVILCTDGDDVTTATRQADDLLGPLRAISEPVMDTWQVTTPGAVLATHMDPSDPVPIQGDHLLLNEIGDDGATELLRLLGEGSHSPLVVAGLRQLGGALSTPDPTGGCLNHIDAHYIYSGAGIPTDPDAAAAITAHTAKVRAALTPWNTGRTAPSFVESHTQPQGHLTAEDIEKIDAVRTRIDPSGLFAADIMPNCTARH